MTFLTDDFLLHNNTARYLYHDHAKHQPIYDYHCHLSPETIAKNNHFRDLSHIWLEGDHYKWRAMRTLGIAERLITGNASPREKFQAYAEAVPHFLGNPLYHWTHLELRRPFGIDNQLLNGETAETIWQQTHALLATEAFTPRGILKQMNVCMVGTTDDPIDTLEHHATIAADSHFDIAIRPSFRPDKILKIDLDDYPEYLAQLSNGNTFADIIDALKNRLDHFDAHGCLSADHGIENLRYATPPTETTLNQTIAKRLRGDTLTETEIAQYQTTLLTWLASEYQRRGWVMQLHIGAIRNNNTRAYRTLGADSGFDSIGDHLIANNLAALLNGMEQTDQLPKTILYTLNPRDNAVLATMCGNYQAEGIRGKVQFGSGWWFNDQKDGMIAQLTTHAQMGILSVFVGMLTDSRSFLSYTRHEYFRRILCNLVGTWVEQGELPNDDKLLSHFIKRICYDNAKAFFETANGKISPKG